jgi:uncharacterized protein (DUF1800 family)
LIAVKRPATAVEAEPTPAPAPASEQRRASEALVSAGVDIDVDRIEHFAHCRSIDELPAELRDNPFIGYVVSMTPEEEARESAAVEAHREADALYGDDPERILAAIEAGTHPLQRRLARG